MKINFFFHYPVTYKILSQILILIKLFLVIILYKYFYLLRGLFIYGSLEGAKGDAYLIPILWHLKCRDVYYYSCEIYVELWYEIYWFLANVMVVSSFINKFQFIIKSYKYLWLYKRIGICNPNVIFTTLNYSTFFTVFYCLHAWLYWIDVKVF